MEQISARVARDRNYVLSVKRRIELDSDVNITSVGRRSRMKRADDFVAWKGGGSLRFVGTNKGRYESAPMKQLFIDLLNDDQRAG